MKKIFINDSGLRNFILNRFPATYNDISGQEAENLAFAALRHYVTEDNLFFYRTISKAEIDFIVDYGQTRDVIEVKFQNKVSGLPVAMRNFTKKYNTQKMILVTKQDFKEEDGRFYIPLPLFEFFLQANIRN